MVLAVGKESVVVGPARVAAAPSSMSTVAVVVSSPSSSQSSFMYPPLSFLFPLSVATFMYRSERFDLPWVPSVYTPQQILSAGADQRLRTSLSLALRIWQHSREVLEVRRVEG